MTADELLKVIRRDIDGILKDAILMNTHTQFAGSLRESNEIAKAVTSWFDAMVEANLDKKAEPVAGPSILDPKGWGHGV